MRPIPFRLVGLQWTKRNTHIIKSKWHMTCTGMSIIVDKLKYNNCADLNLNGSVISVIWYQEDRYDFGYRGTNSDQFSRLSHFRTGELVAELSFWVSSVLQDQTETAKLKPFSAGVSL